MNDLAKNITHHFGQLTNEELTLISSYFHQELIKKGDYSLRTGQYCQKMSFVQNGLLRIFVHTEKKEVTQWITTPQYFVTDLNSFIFQQPARWNIQALTDVELWTITHSDYKKLENILPQWSRIEKYFLSHCFTMMEDRIFSLLALDAEERYLVFEERIPEIFLHVPHQYIASMLGMTPETFSRIRKKLSSKKS